MKAVRQLPGGFLPDLHNKESYDRWLHLMYILENGGLYRCYAGGISFVWYTRLHSLVPSTFMVSHWFFAEISPVRSS